MNLFGESVYKDGWHDSYQQMKQNHFAEKVKRTNPKVINKVIIWRWILVNRNTCVALTENDIKRHRSALKHLPVNQHRWKYYSSKLSALVCPFLALTHDPIKKMPHANIFYSDNKILESSMCCLTTINHHSFGSCSKMWLEFMLEIIHNKCSSPHTHTTHTHTHTAQSPLPHIQCQLLKTSTLIINLYGGQIEAEGENRAAYECCIKSINVWGVISFSQSLPQWGKQTNQLLVQLEASISGFSLQSSDQLTASISSDRTTN